MNTIETLLATDLTEDETERLRDLIARGPLQEKPVDRRLLELKWITHYEMLEGPQDVVDTNVAALGDSGPFDDTASLLREHTSRRRGKK